MHLEGHFTANASQADVYAFLTDPARVSRYMPDVKDVAIDDPDHFTVTARVGVSHIKGSMVMKLEIRDRQPPMSTTVVGTGTGLGSVVDLLTSFSLEAAGDQTLVTWKGDMAISGRLAAFGPQGLLDRIARKNIDTFIEGICRGLEDGASTAR
jgi:carbon monoxide dehydrogenase subunit G